MNNFSSTFQHNEPPPLPALQSANVAAGQILLINPFYAKTSVTSAGKHVLTPALSLTAIAAATPPGFKVRFWDENLLGGAAPADPVPELVGITVHLTFAERAYALAQRYRQLGSVVVLGGLHVTACPDEAQRHADAIVVGAGVQVWPVLLEDHRQGALRSRYAGSYHVPYAGEPRPDRSILPKQAFLTAGSVIATRGCSNRCGFCYLATDGLRMPYQKKPPAQVVAEIRALGERYIVFLDNNLTADRGYAASLCDALEPLHIIWSAAVTIDTAADDALLRKMAHSGCTGVFVGFESMQEQNLINAGKRTMSPARYAEHVKKFHDVGIQVDGSFVFGFDGDGPEVFEHTVDWIEQNRLECATFHILTPYPGTPLFRDLEAAGRLLTRDFGQYNTSRAVFAPARMSAAQLEQGYAYAYRRTFGWRSIWRRRPVGLVAALSYLAMAILYKKCNALWRLLIRFHLTRAVWRPLVFMAWLAHGWRFRAAQRPRAAAGFSGAGAEGLL